MFINLFSKSFFGLNIGDNSIKFVELIKTRNGVLVGKYGNRILPLDIFELGKIKDFERMKTFLASLRKEEGIKSAYVSFPDKYEGNVKDYASVFRDSKIKVKSFQPESREISRAVIKNGDMGTYMIINFGRKDASIFVVSGGLVAFSSSVNIGGEDISEIVAKNLKISLEEAEKIKKDYGMSRDIENKKISQTISIVVSSLFDQVLKCFLNWQTFKDKEGKNTSPIEKIFLCGSEAGLIGLSEYLSVNMRSKVQIANVWINILDTEKKIPKMNFSESLGFVATLGSALGGFSKEKRIDPLL